MSADFADDYIYMSQGEQPGHVTSRCTDVDRKKVTSVCVRDVADQGYPTPGVYASATAAAAEPSSNQVTPHLLVQGCSYTPGA